MCTVSFLPTGKGDFILTSNRDEQASRSPENITEVLQNGVKLIFPRDTAAGGTWIAIADTNKMVCLLNGAFEKHKHRPPYSRSRGIMVLSFFDYDTTSDFFEAYDFKGMEPFTMIIFDNGQLFELRWDEVQTHFKQLDESTTHFWSSSTLYPKAQQERRAKWFANWLREEQAFTKDNILTFHKNGGEGDPFNDLVMNRYNIVQTVSITSVVKKANEISMDYHNLIKEEVKSNALMVQKQIAKDV